MVAMATVVMFKPVHVGSDCLRSWSLQCLVPCMMSVTTGTSVAEELLDAPVSGQEVSIVQPGPRSSGQDA